MQLQKQDIVPTARQLSPKRSRLPGHRHTDQYNEQDIYIGITENEFKTRYNQHTTSFRLSHKSSATSLSEHIWKLKENNTDQLGCPASIGFWDSIREYNRKKVVEIKLGFWDSLRK